MENTAVTLKDITNNNENNTKGVEWNSEALANPNNNETYTKGVEYNYEALANPNSRPLEHVFFKQILEEAGVSMDEYRRWKACYRAYSTDKPWDWGPLSKSTGNVEWDYESLSDPTRSAGLPVTHSVVRDTFREAGITIEDYERMRLEYRRPVNSEN